MTAISTAAEQEAARLAEVALHVAEARWADHQAATEPLRQARAEAMKACIDARRSYAWVGIQLGMSGQAVRQFIDRTLNGDG